MKRPTIYQRAIFTQSLFLSQLLLEHFDVLKDTPFYKHQAKFQLNKAMSEIEKYNSADLNEIYKQAPEASLEVSQAVEELIENITALNPFFVKYLNVIAKEMVDLGDDMKNFKGCQFKIGDDRNEEWEVETKSREVQEQES